MDRKIREYICEILKDNERLLRIPLRQRAKFEGWLKFELASYLEYINFEHVEVESLIYESNERADITFIENETLYCIELKTPNTNFRQNGIVDKHRPITKNINSVIFDAKKLKGTDGIVAFTLFPVPIGNNKWHEYIKKISFETGINVSVKDNCTVLNMSVDDGNDSSIIVCAFKV